MAERQKQNKAKKKTKKNPKRGRVDWGLRQGGEWARSYLKRVAELGIFLFGDVRAANADTYTVPLKGGRKGAGVGYIFPVSCYSIL